MFKQVIKTFFPSADDKTITLLLEDYLLYKQTLVLLFLCLSSARNRERKICWENSERQIKKVGGWFSKRERDEQRLSPFSGMICNPGPLSLSSSCGCVMKGCVRSSRGVLFSGCGETWLAPRPSCLTTLPVGAEPSSIGFLRCRGDRLRGGGAWLSSQCCSDRAVELKGQWVWSLTGDHAI